MNSLSPSRKPISQSLFTVDKSIVFSFLGLISCLLVACSDNSPKHTTLTISPSTIINDSKLSAAERAEKLALGAEHLLTADGFLQAHNLTKQALKQDSKNLRAGLLKVILDPLLLMKGFRIRFKPLDPDPVTSEKTLAEKRELAKTSALERYLLDGKPDIKNEAQAQAFIDQLVIAVDRIRIFARDHKDSELTIKANSLLAPELNEVYADSCELIETPNFDYQVTCPEDRFREQVSLNHADFEFLQHGASYALFSLAFLNSYDLTGLKKVIAIHKDQPPLKTQQIYSKLMKNPHFGKLRKMEGLSHIKDLTLDIFSGVQWSMDNFSSLCSRGESDVRNRPGMLFYQGFCVDSSMAPFLSTGTAFITGTPQDIILNRGPEPRKVQVNYMSLVNKPIDDIRHLGELTFSNCGNITAVGDGSLGGTFPNKDANEKLPYLQPTCDLE